MDPSFWLHQRPSPTPLNSSSGISLGFAIAILLVIFALAVWLRGRARRRALGFEGTYPKGTEALLCDAVAVLGSLLRIPLFAFGVMVTLGRFFLNPPTSGRRRF
ncbi:MAG: hypothetical protein H0V06_00430 [Gemmatimonadetes bacterium]|nr:hypothetical protein [Gemmatimonadota bacterium]MBA3968811.1 hypothetical protein [Gemmatimonadota bacterium]